MSAPPKPSVKRYLKNKKRRSVQKLYSTIGGKNEVVTADFDLAKACYFRMVGDLDQLGAGLSLHLAWARRFFGNATTLAEVLKDKDQEKMGPAASRWAHLDATARRSMNKAIVDRALDPLRHFVTDKDIKRSCEKRDDALLDVNSYARRHEDQKKAAAFDKFSYLDAVAKTDLRKGKLARDALVVEACTVVVAAQAELFAATAKYVVEVADDAFRDDPKIAQYRAELRDLVDRGGPPLVDTKQTRLKTAYDVGVGKKTLGDVRDDERKRRDRIKLHREAKAASSSSSKGGGGGHGGGDGVELPEL